ncbi:hypothetical protein [Acinetobacter radioresistens]|uniref:hypothetical protein n=1 Tax=Acinetobacter radioresistens TaxID=40216 RepID=UPI0020050027|nr:hypothetical protein [Acinetobacter radioresistens]MCK4108879.1 hypothetical protein [Acinetobacter radioresistens]
MSLKWCKIFKITSSLRLKNHLAVFIQTTGFNNMFDVFSRSDSVHGVLVNKCEKQQIYANTKEIMETGEATEIPLGVSYHLVSNHEAQNLVFETAPGLGNGTDTKTVLEMLIHREVSLSGGTVSEAHALAIRTLQLALDALQALSNAA